MRQHILTQFPRVSKYVLNTWNPNSAKPGFQETGYRSEFYNFLNFCTLQLPFLCTLYTIEHCTLQYTLHCSPLHYTLYAVHCSTLALMYSLHCRALTLYCSVQCSTNNKYLGIPCSLRSRSRISCSFSCKINGQPAVKGLGVGHSVVSAAILMDTL